MNPSLESKIGPEGVRYVVELRQNNVPLREVAELIERRYGISVSICDASRMIKRLVVRGKLPPYLAERRLLKRIPPDRQAEIRKLFKEGWSDEEIRERYAGFGMRLPSNLRWRALRDGVVTVRRRSNYVDKVRVGEARKQTMQKT